MIGRSAFHHEDYAIMDQYDIGGLMSDDEEPVQDDEGGDGPTRMKIEDEPEVAMEEADENTMGLIAFPLDPRPAIEYSATGATFHFIKAEIPETFASIPPHVVVAYTTAMVDQMQKLKAASCMQPALPIIVHASPLISMFSNTFVVPKGQPVPDQPPVEIDRFTSFSHSVVVLLTFMDMCINGIIPFHPSVKQDFIKLQLSNYKRQLMLMNATHDRQLDQYYADEEANDPQLLGFIRIMQNFCMRYIHTIEWFLFTCLIQPHGYTNIGSILTPHVFPTLSDCATVAMQEMVIRDAGDFFNYKNEHQGAKIKRWLKDRQEALNFDPAYVFKGCIAFSTMKEYSEAMRDVR